MKRELLVAGVRLVVPGVGVVQSQKSGQRQYTRICTVAAPVLNQERQFGQLGQQDVAAGKMYYKQKNPKTFHSHKVKAKTGELGCTFQG